MFQVPSLPVSLGRSTGQGWGRGCFHDSGKMPRAGHGAETWGWEPGLTGSGENTTSGEWGTPREVSRGESLGQEKALGRHRHRGRDRTTWEEEFEGEAAGGITRLQEAWKARAQERPGRVSPAWQSPQW